MYIRNKNYKQILIIILLVLFNILPVYANGISGIVKDSVSGEPLISATIFLEGTSLGTKTNTKGFYSLQGVKPGKYVIRVTYISYEKYVQEIEIEKSKDLRLDIKLKPNVLQTSVVTVEAEREIEQREITISTTNIPVAQIKEIRVGGESDVFRTLQYLPGVLTSSQLSTGLFVRGGSPDQNLVLLDEAAIYNPSHLFGFFSSFNTNAIKDVNFLKGGFDAEYGSRLSSVLNLTQKDGNRNKYQGDVSLGLISTKADLEGPLGNGAFFISGRRTYLDAITAIMRMEELPDFYFYDINAKIVQDIGNNDKLSITGFMSSDILTYAADNSTIDMNTGNNLLSANWSHIFSDNLFSSVNLSYSNYKINFTGGMTGYDFILDNSIKDFTCKAKLDWYILENAAAKFGFEITKLKFNYHLNFTGDVDSTQNLGDLTSSLFSIPDINYSAFSQIKFNLSDNLALQTGIRFNYYQLNNSFKFDPRAALRYTLNDDISFKLAYGLYHQNIRIATLENFNIVDTWLPSDTTVPISYSNHYIFSVETKVFNNSKLNFDVYYKTMSNISELNMFTLNVTKVSDIVFLGDAESYGCEVFFQKSYGKISGWLGYGLGFVSAQYDSINGGRKFVPKYARKHDFKAVVQYRILDNLEAGGTFILQSGQYYTGATSRVKLMRPDESFGHDKIITSERYGLQLPMSHQLNIYLTYNFKLFDLDSRLSLDIYNVYNRRDIMMRTYNVSEDVTTVDDFLLLPIIPSISYEIRF